MKDSHTCATHAHLPQCPHIHTRPHPAPPPTPLTYRAQGGEGLGLQGTKAVKTEPRLSRPKQSRGPSGQSGSAGRDDGPPERKEQTGTHLLLVVQHLVSFVVGSLLRPPEALLQLGLLSLVSFLHLLLQAGDHLRRRPQRAV